ncbi:MAG: glycosyltransferase 87 family protein [Promethearchaeota archaeon]
MKKELNSSKLDLTPHEIWYLITLLAIALFLHSLFYSLAIWPGDLDLIRFVERSNAALDGKISYRDTELLTDPKPFWTYILAIWLFFCRTTTQILLNIENTNSYDLEFTKILLIIANSIMIVVLFLVSKDLFSSKAAYLTSGFYAINLFPLILCSVVGKYDVIPALFALIAFWMVTKVKLRLSALFLAIGTLFKYLAILPLPILLIFLWRKERDQKLIYSYLMTFGATCFTLTSPFLFINAEKFISSTVSIFILRETHGPNSYYHPYYHIPSQFHIIFPFIFLTLIGVYTFKKECISNYDLVMLLFIESSLFIFTNKSFLSQYFLYILPYLALIFPNMLLSKNKLCVTFERISLAFSMILLPNLFSYAFLKFFIKQQTISFDNFTLSELFNSSFTYELIGSLDGRVFIICFSIIILISILYFLNTQEPIRV